VDEISMAALATSIDKSGRLKLSDEFSDLWRHVLVSADPFGFHCVPLAEAIG